MIGEGVVTAVRVITPLSEYAVTIRNAEFVRSPDGSWRTESGKEDQRVFVSDILDALTMWHLRSQGWQRILDETLGRVQDQSATIDRLTAERVDLQAQLDAKEKEVRTLEDSRDWWMRECGKRGGPQVEPTRGMTTIADITLNASRPLDEARVVNVANAVRAAMDPERGFARFDTDHGAIIVKKGEVVGIAPADRFRTFIFLGGNSVKVEATAKNVALALGWEAKEPSEATEGCAES